MTQGLRCTEYAFNGQFNAHRNVATVVLRLMLYIQTVSVRRCFMNVLAVTSPTLKVLFERVGKPEILNRPDFLRLSGPGAVIACNHVGRADRSPSSIKTAVNILRHGGAILIFPSGKRSDENIDFKRGAATVALHARVPLVPAFFQGPKQMQVAHLLHRPLIRVTFGSPI